MDKQDSYYQCINKYSLFISVHKEAKSTAVVYNVLIRALLLQSIQCDDFAEIKLEITKNLDITPIDIIKHFKSHQLAFDLGEQYNSSYCTSNDFTISRGSRRGVVTDGKEKFDKKITLCNPTLAQRFL